MTMIQGNHYQKDQGLCDGHNAAALTDDVADEIKKEIRNLNNNDKLSDDVRDDLVDKLRTAKKNLETTGKPRKNYNNGLELLEKAKEAREKANDIAAQQKTGNTGKTKGSSGSKKIKSPEMKPQPAEVKLDESKETSKSSETSGSDKSKKDVSQAYENFEAEEFANKMMEDPQAAMDQLDGMKYEEKQMALQEAQMFMQQIQRMTKLQSNLASMAHKTSSAVIQNIR